MDNESKAKRMFDDGFGFENVAVKLDIPLHLAKQWMWQYFGLLKRPSKEYGNQAS